MMVRVFTNSPGDWVQSQVESYQRLKKWYLMPPCLTPSIIRYRSWLKWGNPEKGVAPSLTLWCSSYLKGSLQVILYSGRQLYWYIYLSICVCACIDIHTNIHIYICIHINTYLHMNIYINTYIYSHTHTHIYI